MKLTVTPMTFPLRAPFAAGHGTVTDRERRMPPATCAERLERGRVEVAAQKFVAKPERPAVDEAPPKLAPPMRP